MTLSGLKKQDFTSGEYVKNVILGKLDIISLALTTYLVIFMVLYSTWATYFPEEYALLEKMCSFAVFGFMLHLIAIAFYKKPFGFDFLPAPKKSSRFVVAVIGFGFSAVVMMQFITMLVIKQIPTATVTGLQSIPAAGVNAAAGIAEEWIFAWGLLTVFLLATKAGGKVGLLVSWLVNGIVFMIAHGAVGYTLYMGRSEFLPTIFVSRVALDATYYVSGGRLTASMAVHCLINITRSLVILPIETASINILFNSIILVTLSGFVAVKNRSTIVPKIASFVKLPKLGALMK